MGTKLQAVKCAVDAGVTTIIANGAYPERIHDIVDGEGVCTRFLKKNDSGTN